METKLELTVGLDRRPSDRSTVEMSSEQIIQQNNETSQQQKRGERHRLILSIQQMNKSIQRMFSLFLSLSSSARETKSTSTKKSFQFWQVFFNQLCSSEV